MTFLFQHLGAGKTKADVPGFDLPNVEDLLWGQVSKILSLFEQNLINFLRQTVSGTVERQAAHFFRITVTESDLKAGIIISCKSTGKDKFKTVFFDNQVVTVSGGVWS